MKYILFVILIWTGVANVIGDFNKLWNGNVLKEFNNDDPDGNTIKTRLQTIADQNISNKLRDHAPTTDEVVICLKPGFGILDAKEIASHHKVFNYVKQLVFGKKIFYVFKIDKTVRKTEINVDAQYKDPDIAKLKKEEKVLAVRIQYKNSFSINSVNPQEIQSAAFWNINGLFYPSMNVNRAWNMGYSGKHITVAIVDQYVDLNHKDLKNNMNTDLDYDYVDNDPNPNPPTNIAAHGTVVAGILLAEAGNDLCTVGVAYEATGVGVAVIGPQGNFNADDEQLATYLSHEMNHIDIYSNSWGPGEPYGYVPVGEILEAALETGVQEGRRGRGNIYVFAAGNNFPLDNTNANGILASPFTIAISSVGKNNQTSIYGQVGSSIMAVAYGGDIGVYTDGLVAPMPYSLCVRGVTGTSMSCPVVSGAIALCLQANPELCWRSVQHIIIRTSKKHSFADPNPAYKWQVNGAGLSTHALMGFGLVDVSAMVQMAEKITVLPELNQCIIKKKILLSSSNSIAQVDTIKVRCVHPRSSCKRVRYLESVLVSVEYSYSAKRGSIEFYLYSPFGTKSFLMTERPEDSIYRPNAGTWSWTFKTLQTWGENPCGDRAFGSQPWRLEFRSVDNNVTVTLKEWTLKLFGTAKPPLKGMHVNIISGRKWSPWESLKNSIIYQVESSKPHHMGN